MSMSQERAQPQPHPANKQELSCRLDDLILQSALLFEIRKFVEELNVNSENALENMGAGLINIDHMFELRSDDQEGQMVFDEYNRLVVIENELLNRIEEILEIVAKHCFKQRKSWRETLKLSRSSSQVRELRERIQNASAVSSDGPTSPNIADCLHLLTRSKLIGHDLDNVMKRIYTLLIANSNNSNNNNSITKRFCIPSLRSSDDKFLTVKKKMDKLISEYCSKISKITKEENTTSMPSSCA